jgi:MFS family permease
MSLPGGTEHHQRASLLPVFLIVLVDVFGMTLVIPLLAIYAESFNASAVQATMLVTVYAGCQLVSGPLIGYASDRIGRKPMLIFSQIGTCIGFIILARSTALWMIYLSRVIDGATAGNLSLAQAYIADNTAPEDRAKSFGLIGIAFGLGFFIGPSVTGFMSARFGLTAPIYLAAGMSATSVMATTLLLRGGQGHSSLTADRWAAFRWSTYTQYFSRPLLRARLWQFLFYMMSFSMFISGFALFAERRFTWDGHPFGPREIGYVFGGVGLLGIVLQGALIGRMVKRWGEATLVVAGFASLVLGYFLLGATQIVPLLILTAVIIGFGNSVLRPSLTSLITHQAQRHEQGTVLGVSQALMSGASVVIPILSGYLIEQNMLAMWCWTAGIFAAVGWALTAVGAKESPGLNTSPA